MVAADLLGIKMPRAADAMPPDGRAGAAKRRLAAAPGLGLRPGDGKSAPPIVADHARRQAAGRPAFFDCKQERGRGAARFSVHYTNDLFGRPGTRSGTAF